jgi:hypothetical protein
MSESNGEARFGSLTPTEAANERWRREKLNGDASSTDIAGIVHALKSKALQGDVAASRELREWLAEIREESGQAVDVLELLTKETRAGTSLARGMTYNNPKENSMSDSRLTQSPPALRESTQDPLEHDKGGVSFSSGSTGRVSPENAGAEKVESSLRMEDINSRASAPRRAS